MNITFKGKSLLWLIALEDLIRNGHLETDTNTAVFLRVTRMVSLFGEPPHWNLLLADSMPKNPPLGQELKCHYSSLRHACFHSRILSPDLCRWSSVFLEGFFYFFRCHVSFLFGHKSTAYFCDSWQNAVSTETKNTAQSEWLAAKTRVF